MALEQGRVEEVDGDTFLNGYSIEAAKRASGAVVAAVDHVFSTEGGRAFCCTRPPGHHANHNVSMGFCLVNHVVVGLKYARRKYGISRVAVLDFDVHVRRIVMRCWLTLCGIGGDIGVCAAKITFNLAAWERDARPIMERSRSFLCVHPPVSIISRLVPIRSAYELTTRAFGFHGERHVS